MIFDEDNGENWDCPDVYDDDVNVDKLVVLKVTVISNNK